MDHVHTEKLCLDTHMWALVYSSYDCGEVDDDGDDDVFVDDDDDDDADDDV